MAQNKFSIVPLIGLLTVMFFIFLVSTAFVEEKNNTKTKPGSENSSAGMSAMKVGKDSDGSLRMPTHAEENKLNAELKKTMDKYPKHSPEHRPDGSISLVVAPHRIHAAVAHVGPDGKLHLNCSDDQAHVKLSVQPKQELAEE
jgi:hypothetical protein